MYDLQRNKIIEMRLQGYGYKAIAAELGISRDTVKGYCKRNHLSGPGEVAKQNFEVMLEKNEVCSYCSKRIKQVAKGRTRRFCSDECRRKWWNENPEKRNKNDAAIYKYTCPNCGKEFGCYGNKRRKYCSHDCYIKSRFWKGDEDGI